ARQNHTHHGLERLGDHLAEKRLDACSQHLHVVGKSGHQLVGAVIAEIVDVEMNDIPIEPVAQIEKRKVDHAAYKRFLPKFEETFHGHGYYDQAQYAHERLERIGRQKTRALQLQ